MSTVIEDFFVALGFQVDASQLSAFEEQVAQANETLLTLGQVAVGAAAGVFAFVSGVTSGIDDLADFAAVNYANIEGLQELGFAAQASGSSLEAVKGSVASLNNIIGEAALGVGKGAATFEKLGLSARDSTGAVKGADVVLQEIADRFVGLSKEEKIALASKLGVDASLIPLLSQGSESIAVLRAEARELGVVTQEEADISGTLGDALDRLSFLGLALSRSIAVSLTPAVEAVVTSTKEWLLRNRDFIKSGISTAVAVLTTVLGTLWTIATRILDVFAPLVKVILESKIALTLLAVAGAAFIALNIGRSIQGAVVAMRALAASAMAANVSIAFIPLAIGAVAIALGLLLDDLLTFQEGGESVIGDLVAKFPQLGEVLTRVSDVVRSVFGFWRNIASQVEASITPLLASLFRLASVLFDVLWPVVKTIFTGWVEVLGLVLPPLANIATFIVDVVAAAITFAVDKMTSFVDKIKGAADYLADFFGAGSEVAVNATSTRTNTTTGIVSGAGVIAGNNSSSSNSSAVTTSNITAPITIITSDPAKAGESVRKELEAANKQTTRNGQTATKL